MTGAHITVAYKVDSIMSELKHNLHWHVYWLCSLVPQYFCHCF